MAKLSSKQKRDLFKKNIQRNEAGFKYPRCAGCDCLILAYGLKNGARWWCSDCGLFNRIKPK